MEFYKPGGEGLELRLRLRHVRVEVVEFSQTSIDGAIASVGVGGVESLVVLNVHEDIVLAGFLEEMLVFGKELDGGLGDHDMDLTLDGIEGDRVMCWVGSEDCNCIAGTESIDCFLVGFWIPLFITGEGVEAGIQTVILTEVGSVHCLDGTNGKFLTGFGNVLLQMGSNAREFVARCSDH